MTPNIVDAVTALGAAISDPTRVATFIFILEHQGCTVGEVARALGYTSSTVSHHLDVLAAAKGLVQRRRQGTRTHIYARADRFRLVHDASLGGAPR